MLLFTPTLRRAGLVVAALFTALTAPAQTTAPAWTGASALGAGQMSSGSLATDAAGNTYVAGSFSGTTTIGGTTLTSAGGLDGYLAKFTPTGTLAWVFPFASTGNDLAQDVALDADGYAYVAGSFVNFISLGNSFSLTGTGTGATRAFVARFTPQGVPQWVQQNNTTSTASGQTIGVDANGWVYVAGQFSTSVSFGAPAVGANSGSGFGTYLAVLSAANGTVRTVTTAFDYINLPTGPTSYPTPRLAVVPAGGAYLLNTFAVSTNFGSNRIFTTRGGNDALVAKYSGLGVLEWADQLGGSGADQVQDGKVDAAGNLYLGGNFTGPATFGTATLTSVGGVDGYVAKYSPQGTLLWVSSSGGPTGEGWGSISLDAAGNPYATGNFTGTAQFGATTLTSAGATDIVVAAYSPQGQVRWVQQAGGNLSDVGFHLGFDALGQGYVLGNFSSSPCNFGPYPLSATTTPTNFMARLGATPLTTRPTAPQPLGLYPNPASGTVHLPALPAGTPVLVLDARGRVAREAVVSASGQVVVRGLGPGLYTLRATTAQGQPLAGKLVVE
ncbi:T9SS type A sorting domain-containing protein [Hymenobacter lucidus]|uniref:T9SS type A sorting domain-containing protein n=1 Tax=Hymenobacter lucidus TaxID=2880930 RepID=A0ABS8ARE8_9BACT|nr:T9SS type A sorting domain-containing protein [Hymenobacter lucidus]MCB2408788.1 T9SS type A sorting domain-containing protein [Hymenobacter lucidus]